MADLKLAAWRTQTEIDAEEAEQEAERQRITDLKADALRQDMLDKLRTATPTQISNYVDNNVTDLASARTMFKRLILILSTFVRD